MRTMYDSVTAASIPADAEMVAGYIDAGYVWSAEDWARFPNATKVEIAVYPDNNRGHVIDIEPGNWEPPDAPAWVAMRRRAGLAMPTVYTMLSWWQWCIDEFDRQGEPQPLYWIARWDGTADLPAGQIANQWANGTMLGTGYDLNVVADHWPGLDDEEDDMPITQTDADLIAHTISNWGFHGPPYDEPRPNDRNWVQSWETRNNTRALLGQVAALGEAVKQLSGGSELDLQAVRDAAEQGVRTALEEGTVHVDVDVTGPEGTGA